MNMDSTYENTKGFVYQFDLLHPTWLRIFSLLAELPHHVSALPFRLGIMYVVSSQPPAMENFVGCWSFASLEDLVYQPSC